MPDIRHIFVLMLENRSFDHMFGLSGIPDIRTATSADHNIYGNRPYHFGPHAPNRMPWDPHHGFSDVMTQLAGEGAEDLPATPYPPRTNSGFVASFAKGLRRPDPDDLATVMRAVDLPRESPALYTLATEYAVCDEWYASMPGATWPNRFFVHGASSAGLARGPTTAQKVKWALDWGGFKYPNGSIFDRLRPGSYRLYQNQDRSSHRSGRLPQVAALKGVRYDEVRPLRELVTELAAGRAAAYTFIEPAYGDVVSGSYRGGSSQHPLDDLAKGDRLIARVYRAIRNSPVWKHSLLIITYDEHGGFYDSCIPARAAPPSNDDPDPDADDNPFGFDFSVYGVRVPTVLVSPWIGKGVVDHTLYDHASILATVERRFDLDPLTDRDRLAADVLHLLGGSMRPDAECPREVPQRPARPALAEAEPDLASLAEPIEDGDNLLGFLFVAEKAQREVAPETLAFAPLPEPKTRGEAELYLEQVVPRLEEARDAQQLSPD
ncbi:MAG: phospholipase [Sphingomonadales bacterium]|jgi:phospholipase C|nr:phospholipase [Sphingomonadales bacterium]